MQELSDVLAAAATAAAAATTTTARPGGVLLRPLGRQQDADVRQLV